MLFDYAYKGSSTVASSSAETDVSFVPDATREPTYFTGELRQKLEFREAISALHDVVVSDLRFKPKDKTAYKEWAAQREEIDWQQVAAQRAEVSAQIKILQAELTDLNNRRSSRWQPFYNARAAYYKYLYEKHRNLWFVLDPVITVHPDEVFFECFSEDESSYGRLGANYEVFKTSRISNAERRTSIIPPICTMNFEKFALIKAQNLKSIRRVSRFRRRMKKRSKK